MFLMIMGSIHQGEIIILIFYAPNNKGSKYMKQLLTELKKEIDKSTIIAEDIKPLWVMDRISRKWRDREGLILSTNLT